VQRCTFVACLFNPRHTVPLWTAVVPQCGSAGGNRKIHNMMIAGRIPGSIASAQTFADQRVLRSYARPQPCPSLRSKAVLQYCFRAGFAQQRRNAHKIQKTSCSAAVLTAPGDEAGKCSKMDLKQCHPCPSAAQNFVYHSSNYDEPLLAVPAKAPVRGHPR
jgi:hypothetical protein